MEGQITQVAGGIFIVVGIAIIASDYGGGPLSWTAIVLGLLFIPLGGIWSTLEKILKK